MHAYHVLVIFQELVMLLGVLKLEAIKVVFTLQKKKGPFQQMVTNRDKLRCLSGKATWCMTAHLSRLKVFDGSDFFPL